MLRAGTNQDVARLHDSFWNRNETFYTWGNESLDMALPLLSSGQLVVLAGAQASGKTTWSMQIALANARAGQIKGYTVGYLALEVKPENILKRMVERRLDISKEDRRRGAIFDLDNIAQKKVDSEIMFKSFIDSGLMLFGPQDYKDNPYHIDTIAKFCADPTSPKLLIIDNLAEIQSDDKDEYTRTDNILRTLSDVRKHTDTTIILLHHLAKPRLNESFNINSIKGNNITITKADITVAIDRHDERNPNWECLWKDSEGELVEQSILKKFYSFAPKIRVRSIHSLKDRDYGIEGHLGYMELDNDGNIDFLDKAALRLRAPLIPEQKNKLESAYAHFGLLTPKSAQNSDDNAPELFPW